MILWIFYCVNISDMAVDFFFLNLFQWYFVFNLPLNLFFKTKYFAATDIFYFGKIQVSTVFVFRTELHSPKAYSFVHHNSANAVNLLIKKSQVSYIQSLHPANTFYFRSGKLRCISQTLLAGSIFRFYEKRALDFQGVPLVFQMFSSIKFRFLSV